VILLSGRRSARGARREGFERFCTGAREYAGSQNQAREERGATATSELLGASLPLRNIKIYDPEAAAPPPAAAMTAVFCSAIFMR
jgi:hypothetical protein